MTMHRIVIACLALSALTAALTGCSGAAAPAVTVTVEAPAAETGTPTPVATSSPMEDLGPNYVKIRADETKPFGSYFFFNTNDDSDAQYSKAVVIQVDELDYFTPNSYAAIDKSAERYRKYRVTVTNNTSRTIDLAGWVFSAQDGDETASQVFDDELDGNPKGRVLAGRKLKLVVGFGAENNDEVVSIEPLVNNERYEPATFSN